MARLHGIVRTFHPTRRDFHIIRMHAPHDHLLISPGNRQCPVKCLKTVLRAYCANDGAADDYDELEQDDDNNVDDEDEIPCSSPATACFLSFVFETGLRSSARCELLLVSSHSPTRACAGAHEPLCTRTHIHKPKHARTHKHAHPPLRSNASNSSRSTVMT